MCNKHDDCGRNRRFCNQGVCRECSECKYCADGVDGTCGPCSGPTMESQTCTAGDAYMLVTDGKSCESAGYYTIRDRLLCDNAIDFLGLTVGGMAAYSDAQDRKYGCMYDASTTTATVFTRKDNPWKKCSSVGVTGCVCSKTPKTHFRGPN